MNFSYSSKPIFLQIADRISDDVLSGVYPPGTRIPSVREFAADMQVNANTVMRAYDLLSGSGIIFNKRGVGYFIPADGQERALQYSREAFMRDEMPYFLMRLSKMGVAPDELASIYSDFIKQQQK